MPSTYKVWMHIEEIDEDGDPTEDEPTMPEQLGEYDTLDEAQAAIDAAMSNPATEPRPSAREKSEGNHTPEPWKVTDYDKKDGIQIESTAGYTVAWVQYPKDAALVAAAPELLAALEALLDEADLGEVDERTAPIAEQARAAIAKARGE